MNNFYRHASPRGQRLGRHGAKSSLAKGLGLALLLLAAVGVFVLLVMWFRHGAKESTSTPNETTDKPAATTPDDGLLHAVSAAAVAGPETITLSAVTNDSSTASATRNYADSLFTLTILATLPAIDGSTEAYEAWYIKPGITDFFSLGEMYPREDGAWGLVWSVSDALARPDLAEFDKILITREARDGNAAPSTNQVLQGEF